MNSFIVFNNSTRNFCRPLIATSKKKLSGKDEPIFFFAGIDASGLPKQIQIHLVDIEIELWTEGSIF